MALYGAPLDQGNVTPAVDGRIVVPEPCPAKRCSASSSLVFARWRQGFKRCWLALADEGGQSPGRGRGLGYLADCRGAGRLQGLGLRALPHGRPRGQPFLAKRGVERWRGGLGQRREASGAAPDGEVADPGPGECQAA